MLSTATLKVKSSTRTLLKPTESTRKNEARRSGPGRVPGPGHDPRSASSQPPPAEHRILVRQRQRESAGHSKQLGITNEGSKLLRWVLVVAAW
jgi:hypothetical protein